MYGLWLNTFSIITNTVFTQEQSLREIDINYNRHRTWHKSWRKLLSKTNILNICRTSRLVEKNMKLKQAKAKYHLPPEPVQLVDCLSLYYNSKASLQFSFQSPSEGIPGKFQKWNIMLENNISLQISTAFQYFRTEHFVSHSRSQSWSIWRKLTSLVDGDLAGKVHINSHSCFFLI